MADFESFERDLRFATKGLQPEAINRELAKFAKVELRRVISTGQASSTYERYVNHVKGALEESVKAPGPILYEFVNWPLVIRAALAELQRRSPRRSGRYAGGFIVLANGGTVQDFARIPIDAEVVIFNARPYTRKIEIGANKTGKRHVDGAKSAMARRFRDAFKFETRFLNVASGIHPEVPYRLKNSQGRRKDRQAGGLLTYPSIVINAVR
nr:hypothetical protein RAR13_04310 [Aminobacter aminovorans]